MKCIDEEIPFEIPESWEWVRWRSVFQINPKNSIEDSLKVSFVPMTYIKDGYSNEAKFDIKQWKDIKSGFTHFQNNDLGIAKITPCFENRKSVIFTNLHNDYGAGTTELHIFRPFAFPLLSQYALYIAKSEDFISNGVANFSGAVGQQRVGKDIIGDYLIALPPLEEISKILTTVSELFLVVDGIKKNQMQLSTCIQNFKSKILDLAIRGKLVPQDPNDEPASVLLERIKSEHPESKKKPLKTSDNSHYTFDIPKFWMWAQVGEVGIIITGNTPSKDNKKFYGDEFPFYKPTDLEQGINVYSAIDNLSLLGYEVSRQLPLNTILVTCIGATIGKVGLIKKEGSCNQQINALIPYSGIDSKYFYYCFTSPFFQTQIRENASATTLPIINKNKFESLCITLPPLQEQNRIVQKIEDIFSSLDEIANSIKV